MDFKELLTYLKGIVEPSVILAIAGVVYGFKTLKKILVNSYKYITIAKDLHEKIQNVKALELKVIQLEHKLTLIFESIQKMLEENKVRDEKTHALLTVYKKEKHDAEGQRDLLMQSLQQLIKSKNENT